MTNVITNKIEKLLCAAEYLDQVAFEARKEGTISHEEFLTYMNLVNDLIDDAEELRRREGE